MNDKRIKRQRLFRVLLKGATTYYTMGGGEETIEARGFREALDVYCSQSGWEAPPSGTRYEYVVIEDGTYATRTFTVEPTQGYTVTAW